MTKATKTSWNNVWVKDDEGTQFVCSADAVRGGHIDFGGCQDYSVSGVPVGD